MLGTSKNQAAKQKHGPVITEQHTEMLSPSTHLKTMVTAGSRETSLCVYVGYANVRT